MSQFFIDTNANPGASVNTLSAQGGAATAPDASNNFDFAGTATGAITFATPSVGHMTAAVNVDGVTITVNGSNQLSTVAGITGTATTVGAVTGNVITVTPTDLKGFSIQCLVSGYDTANNETIGGEILATGRKSTTVSILGTPDKTWEADTNLATGSYDLIASGATFVVQVTGVAGRTIDWGSRLIYVQSP